MTRPKVSLRQHSLAPHYGLDRVKLSIQRGPLGGFDRSDGERLELLWNSTRHLSEVDLMGWCDRLSGGTT